MKRVAVLRCGKLPGFVNWEVPNLEELFEEDNLLCRGLEARGFRAEPVVWNRPDVDWSQFDLALIRSTWDYLDEHERFLQVLSNIEASPCRLFNPLAAVRWNIDKRYLFDVQKWGLPILPTSLASQIPTDPQQHPAWDGRPVDSVILKPTIGLGGSHSHRVAVEDLPGTLAALRARQAHQEFLIQPFVDSVVTEGEWSFIYFNRQLSHVLLKRPAPGDYRVQAIYGGTVRLAEPRPGDLVQAEALMAQLPFDVLYARLDFIRLGGQLSVIEVELIEPIFCFNLAPESIGRLADAIRVRLGAQA